MILHRLANTLLKALMPLSAIRHAQSFGWDDEWLADIEADHDVWEARHNFTGDSFPSKKVPSASPVNGATTPPVVVRPADAEPAQVCGVGGAFKSDEQIIHELVEDYREFLRACFGKK